MPLTRRALGLSLMALAVSGIPALAQFSSDDYDDAETAVMSAGTTAKKVAALRHVSGLSTFNMRFRNWGTVPFEFDRSPQALGITVEKNAAGVAALRRALARNPVTARALADHGVPVGRVVGVRIYSNGWLRVYFL